MNEEGVFPRLLELIQQKTDDDIGLHRLLLELLYEMSRIQRLKVQDLSTSELSHKCQRTLLKRMLTGTLVLIEDDFIAYMFQIIEGLSDDVNDPYHYPVIRVLVPHFS